MGAGRKTFCIRVIVLHIGKLLHQGGVLTVLLYSRENELVIEYFGQPLDERPTWNAAA